MKWRTAYHSVLDEDIPVTLAIDMRENKDPRCGDIWCCAECYKAGKGFRLNARKEAIKLNQSLRQRPCKL